MHVSDIDPLFFKSNRLSIVPDGSWQGIGMRHRIVVQ